MKVVFVDFYEDYVLITNNGRLAYIGGANVSKANESTGLAFVKYWNIGGCNDFHMRARHVSVHRDVCITKATKILYVEPQEPYFSTSERDVVELD